MLININQNLVETLNRLATSRSTTPELYVENFVNSHLISQRKQHLVEIINTQKEEDIGELETAVNIAFDKIKANTIFIKQ